MALAPSMATRLQPELVVGRPGAGNPPPSPPPGMQHLKLAGPGHLLVSVMPEAQDDVKRQFPLLSVPHLGLVQHLIFSGVPGQAFDI